MPLQLLCGTSTMVTMVTTEETKPRQLVDWLLFGYRREIRPVRNQSSPTNITVQFFFKQLLKVREADQLLTVYCWLEQYWLDEYLLWDPAHFGGIEKIHIPANLIWQPDLLVYNNAAMNGMLEFCNINQQLLCPRSDVDGSDVGRVAATGGVCRFCGNLLSDDRMTCVCDHVDCQRLATTACCQTLLCGHPCGGIIDEIDCLPCLRCNIAGGATEAVSNLRQDNDDLCVICFTDRLGAAPSIQLECGHVFHHHCVNTTLSRRWNGPRIAFGFLHCPLCKAPIEHSTLRVLLEPLKALYNEVASKAKLRLEYDALVDDPSLKSANSPFYNDPISYALDRYVYVLCNRCGKAYFGGESQCQQLINSQYNPEELVCGGCSDVSRAEICAKHGSEYLEYKCRFCCSIAVYFCFGTTHFCTGCHDDFQRLMSLPKQTLPQCPVGPKATPLADGVPAACPLKITHRLERNCWQYWLDEYLLWDPAHFGGIEKIHIPANLIWQPDLLVYNNANMNVKESELQTNAIVQYDGRVSLFRAVITDVSCSLDMTYFPFDQQFCQIMLASWSYDGSQVLLDSAQGASPAFALSYYKPNMEWGLVDFKLRTNLKYYDCCPAPFPDLSYYFSIKRNPTYYLMTLIVPSAFITIVTVVGFFTPHFSDGENQEKVSLGVTALLSLAIILMMVSDKLPATSKVVPLLGKYYVGLIVIMFTATCFTTVTLSVQMSGNYGRALPKHYRWLLNCWWLRPLIYVDRVNACTLIAADSDAFPPAAFFDETTMKRRKHAKINSILRTTHGVISAATAKPIGDLTTSAGGTSDLLHLCSSVSSACSVGVSPSASPVPPSAGAGGRRASTVDVLREEIAVKPLKDVLRTLNAIRHRLDTRIRMDIVRHQWQQLARGCERLLMAFFIAFAIAFVVFMLYDDRPPLIITEQMMNESSI